MENQIERRRTRRYPVNKSVYAVLTPFFKVIGPIIDVSQNGLSFYYHILEDCKDCDLLSDNKQVDLSVVSNTGDFFLNGIQIKVVSDIEAGRYSENSQIQIKRCSLMFEKMGNNMQAELEALIQKLVE